MSAALEPAAMNHYIRLDQQVRDKVDFSIRLPLDHIVSKTREGAVASHLGDLHWDWSAYVLKGGRAVLSFNYWDKTLHRTYALQIAVPPERREMVADMQHIMSLVVFKRQGATYSYGILFAFLSHLRRMARLCEERGFTLDELLGDAKRLEAYGRTIKGGTLARFSGLIGILVSLDAEKDIGFYVAGNPILRELKERVTTIINGADQTAPVPSRIYSHLISALGAEIDAIDKVLPSYFSMARSCIAIQKTHPPGTDRWQNVVRNEIESHAVLNQYFEDRRMAKDPKGVTRGLREMQVVCKLMIQTFSGMRDAEVLMLPYHCIEREASHGGTHYVLCGSTTKFNRGKMRRTRWVTSEDGYRAATIARRIAKFIYGVLELKPETSSVRLNQYLLFVRPSYLGLGIPKPRHEYGIARATSLNPHDEGYERLYGALFPIIIEADLVELDAIDPHRAWRSEADFKLGMPWVLKSHQLRRSLALYAQRSGLVSLPSLRRQLQHITREMSRYYAKGASFAINFIDCDADEAKKHVAQEWRDAKPMSEALSFLRHVVLSDEELFGGAGAFEQGKKNRGEITERAMTITRFKRGEISYRETPLGGCIKVGDCSVIGLQVVDTDCLRGCENMIGKMSRLESVIRHQEALVAMTDPNSVAFRMDQSDLRALHLARDKWQATSIRRVNVRSIR